MSPFCLRRLNAWRSTAGWPRKSIACGWDSSNRSTLKRSRVSSTGFVPDKPPAPPPLSSRARGEEDRFHLRRDGHGVAPIPRSRSSMRRIALAVRARDPGAVERSLPRPEQRPGTRDDTERDRQSRPRATWGFSRGLGHRWLRSSAFTLLSSTRQTRAKPLIPLEEFSRFFGMATVFELGIEPGAGRNLLVHVHFG